MEKGVSLNERAAAVLDQLQSGEVSARSAASFQRFLEYASGMDDIPARRQLLGKVVPPEEKPPLSELGSAQVPPAWRRRPGLWAVFEPCHRDGIEDVTCGAGLRRGDPFEQLVSLARVETQDPLRRVIGGIWPGLEREMEGVRVEQVSGSSPEEAMFRLKRQLSSVARRHVEVWRRQALASETYRRLDQTLALRRLTPEQALIHGFNAAVAATLNSLLVLFEKVLEKRSEGSGRLQPEVASVLVRSHESFALALSRFNLNSFAALFRLLTRVPEPSRAGDAAGQIPFDARFESRYFVLRESFTASELAILDLEPSAFSAEELVGLRSAALRKGCPAGRINPCLVGRLGDLFLQTVAPWWIEPE